MLRLTCSTRTQLSWQILTQSHPTVTIIYKKLLLHSPHRQHCSVDDHVELQKVSYVIIHNHSVSVGCITVGFFAETGEMKSTLFYG